ncbi:hypothetical protein IFM89_018883 [Coptis chinensis]|uniref:CRIB domain-containing protein n=1 Tax=Coptis chinensis TaxID=261450 RepID=A0A835HFP6_9MAGN|nr:hypothetical protein IFM89_018883 [Coptis chinensis]
MSSSREDDRNKPVIGYPTAYPPGHPNYDHNTHTGHPYPVPSTNRNPYPAHSYNRNSTTFCGRLLIALIATMVIFSVVSFISWLIFRTILPEFRVDIVVIPPSNTSASVISPKWEFGFVVENPNKKINISYDALEVSLFHGEEFLCETYFLPSDQLKNSHSFLWAEFRNVEERVVKLISEDRKRGMVNLNVKLTGWIRFKAGWGTRRHLLKVLCMDVGIQFDSRTGLGTWAGGLEGCEVS